MIKSSIFKICLTLSVYVFSIYPTASYADFTSVLNKLTSDEHLESLSFDRILAESKSESQGENQQENLKEMIPLMVAATEFKELATNDYASALLTLSKAKGMEKLHNIDIRMWDVKLCQVGWNLFFNSSVRIYNKELHKYPLVAYYNPFSDTYLITVWEKDNAQYKIVDAEMLMGDFVRRAGKKIEGTPLWLRGKSKRTVNLGISTAVSTLAFEEVFSKVSVKNWRSKLKILRDADVLKTFNYPNIATSLNSHLLNVIHFSTTKDHNTQLQECHKITVETVAAVKDGTINTLLKKTAVDTPKDTIDILTNTSRTWIDDYTPASALNIKNECLVFLTNAKQSMGSLALLLKRNNADQLLLNRIDLIDYKQFYKMVEKMQEKKLKEVSR